MQRWLGVLALAGCNQVFDLKPTVLPPPDAPPRCPDNGPVPFSNRLIQAVAQPCFSYTFSEVTGRAVAVCPNPDSAAVSSKPFVVAEGPIDGELVPVADIALDRFYVNAVTLAADGSELWLDLNDATLDRYGLSAYRRSADQHWTHDYDLDLDAGNQAVVIGQFATPAGQRLLVNLDPQGGTNRIVELADDGSGRWSTTVRTFDIAQLGVDYFDMVGVSPDGRRLVFTGEVETPERQVSVYEADRTDPTADFSPATPNDAIPATYGTAFYMTADCSRLYFSALDSVFYVLQ